MPKRRKRTRLSVAHSTRKKQRVLDTPEDLPSIDQRGNNEEITVITNTSEYHKVVKSYAFVDKTLHIRSVFGNIKDKIMETLLMVAPLRCGKSTNMDMIKSFLEIDADEEGNPKINVKKVDGKWKELPEKQQTENFKLFKKLKIYNCQHVPKHREEECSEGKCEHRNFFYENCCQHPVIFFNLQRVKSGAVGEFKGTLQIALGNVYRNHLYLGDARSHLHERYKKKYCEYEDPTSNRDLDEASILSGLEFLAQCLYMQFQKEVFVLIEEFDAPISRMLFKPTTQDEMGNVIEVIGNVIAGVLKNPRFVQVSGALVNAIVDIKGTISSHANNVTSRQFLEDNLFADYCGFTYDEVNELLGKHAFRNIDKHSILDYYNGYKVLDRKTKIYNTYSVVMYLSNWVKLRKNNLDKGLPSPTKKVCSPRSYWREHGVNNLEKLLSIPDIREKFLDISEKGFITINDGKQKLTPGELFLLQNLLNYSENRKLSNKEIEIFFHYLKHRGYLYTTEKIPGQIRLEIPNLETSYELRQKLYSSDFYETHFQVKPRTYLETLQSLNRNNKNTFETLVKSIVEMFPSVKPSRHDELKGILFTYAFQNQAYYGFKKVRSEPLVVAGKRVRPDLLIWRDDGTGIILEIASGKEDEKGALDQIFEKKYYEGLTKDQQKIYIGLHYDYDTGNAKLCAHITDGGKTTKRLSKQDRQKLICYQANKIQKSIEEKTNETS